MRRILIYDQRTLLSAALIATGASWGASLADSPLDVILVVLALASVASATAVFAIWWDRARAMQKKRDIEEEHRDVESCR